MYKIVIKYHSGNAIPIAPTDFTEYPKTSVGTAEEYAAIVA